MLVTVGLDGVMEIFSFSIFPLNVPGFLSPHGGIGGFGFGPELYLRWKELTHFHCLMLPTPKLCKNYQYNLCFLNL